MSKMDALRAMREAKYEAAQKAAGSGTTARRPVPASGAPAKPAAKATKAKATKAKAPTPAETPEGAEALCGHRNMSGRTCTREQGHAAKSHRYS